jgi:hypothetical protein
MPKRSGKPIKRGVDTPAGEKPANQRPDATAPGENFTEDSPPVMAKPSISPSMARRAFTAGARHAGQGT